MLIGLNNSHKIKKEFLSYLKKKYDKEFVAVSYTPRTRDNDKDVLICHEIGANPKTDFVTVNRRGTIKYTYDDTYFSVMIRPQVESFFNNIGAELSLKTVSKYLARDFFAGTYDKNKNYKDVLAEGKYKHLVVSVVIEAPGVPNLKAVNDSFIEKVILTRFQGTFVQYYLKPEFFKTLNDDNAEDLLYEGNGYVAHYSRTVCLC